MENILIHISDVPPPPAVEVFVVSIHLLDAAYFTTDNHYIDI
jgi:hypothetical protein